MYSAVEAERSVEYNEYIVITQQVYSFKLEQGTILNITEYTSKNNRTKFFHKLRQLSV